MRETYVENGASEHVIQLEMEAFHVATFISAETLTTAVEKVCQL